MKRMKLRMHWLAPGAAAAISVGLVMALSGCAQGPAAHNAALATTPSPEATPGPMHIANRSTAVGRAEAAREAVALLGRAILPPGATKVSTFDALSLAAAPGVPACSPISVATQRYVVTGRTSMQSVMAFVEQHLVPGLRTWSDNSESLNGVTNRISFTESSGQGRPVLEYSVAPLTDGSVALRVDATALAPGFACIFTGVADH